MGICQGKEYKAKEPIPKSVIINEVNTEIKPIQNSIKMPVPSLAMKSICKISIGNVYGNGFFMKISDSQKYLITNNHFISQDNINNNIEIEIYNHKKMKLNLDNRNIKYYPKPKDITTIEIKNNDSIYQDIEFLDCDLNYKEGYQNYKYSPIFSINYPNGESVSGKIIDINGFEFTYDISPDKIQFGSPIIIGDINSHLFKVIGIHKEINYSKQISTGTFFGEILNNDQNNKIKKNNYIIAEIEIKGGDINKDIKIINSYEENKRGETVDKKIDKKYMNEEEIKKCEIRINEELIPFNYFHKFKNKGKYTINYSFKKNLTKVNHMFAWCFSLTKINLSNFNTQNIIDMSHMFSGCISLKSINFSNCNAQNVLNVECLFDGCSSLANLDLTNFNSPNIYDMSSMFYGCSSLKEIDLSNLSTQHLRNMSWMFYDCFSLRNINLSKFTTEKVTDMSHMFEGCLSLKNLNILNFVVKPNTKISQIFKDCNSLKKENIINKDKMLFDKYFKDNNITKNDK